MTPARRFEFMEQARQQRPQWKAARLCRILGVSRSGYAAWHKRQSQPPWPRQQEEARLVLQIRAAHRKGRHYYGNYGSPRVWDELREQGIQGIGLSRKRVAGLMPQQGLRGRCRGRRVLPTTDWRHALPVAPNLLARRFAPQQIGRLNRFWCGDITGCPLGGWPLRRDGS